MSLASYMLPKPENKNNQIKEEEASYVIQLDNGCIAKYELEDNVVTNLLRFCNYFVKDYFTNNKNTYKYMLLRFNGFIFEMNIEIDATFGVYIVTVS